VGQEEAEEVQALVASAGGPEAEAAVKA